MSDDDKKCPHSKRERDPSTCSQCSIDARYVHRVPPRMPSWAKEMRQTTHASFEDRCTQQSIHGKVTRG